MSFDRNIAAPVASRDDAVGEEGCSTAAHGKIPKGTKTDLQRLMINSQERRLSTPVPAKLGIISKTPSMQCIDVKSLISQISDMKSLKCRWGASLAAALVVLVFLGIQEASAYYDPGVQRWINRDPAGEVTGRNLYSFLGNGAVARADPDGYTWVPTHRPASGNHNTVICYNNKLKPRLVMPYTPQELMILLPEKADQDAYFCVMKCVREHENSHIKDITAQNPNICVGVANGTTIRSTDPNTELLASEQRAHKVSLECLAKCKPCRLVEQEKMKSQQFLDEHQWQ
jgi:hypothetical protein